MKKICFSPILSGSYVKPQALVGTSTKVIAESIRSHLEGRANAPKLKPLFTTLSTLWAA